MQNSTLLFPTSQLINANSLIFPSLNPLINHSAHTTLSQKRYLDLSYVNASDNYEPAKKHFKSEFALNPIRSNSEEPIIIDDCEDLTTQSISFSQKNNFQDLLQLSLFSAYLEQMQQAREVERRYSVLFANFSQSLFNQGRKDSDVSTNDSDIDSISHISHQPSPVANKPRRMSIYMNVESDTVEEIVIGENESKKDNGQITISADLLADLPNLERKTQNRNARSKGLKMVWNPSEKKVEDIEKLINELEEGLNIKISNQERVCKVFSENGFSVKETVKTVLSQRSKYRFELKDKRAVVSMKNKSMKL